MSGWWVGGGTQNFFRRRIHSGGEVSSHGRVHMGLAATFLRMPEEAYGRLVVMATGESMYASMMCSHEPDARIFNCDANGAMPEIMHRMILQSRPGLLELLPALPNAWPRGEIRGIKSRQRITINRLAWDRMNGRLTLELTSECDQSILLRVPNAETIQEIATSGSPANIQPSGGTPNQRTIALKGGEAVEFKIRVPSNTNDRS